MFYCSTDITLSKINIFYNQYYCQTKKDLVMSKNLRIFAPLIPTSP